MNQSFKDFEYIIIDGNSDDNTLNIIKRYEEQIDYWLSQKDNGIYDAFNKGVNLCRGEYIGIINSDDVYTKDALKIIYKYIKNYPEKDFIFGSVKKHWGILHGFKPEKSDTVGVFTPVTPLVFLLKETQQKKMDLIIQSISFTLIMIIFTE